MPARDRVLFFSDQSPLSMPGSELIPLVGRLAPLLTRGTERDAVMRIFGEGEREEAARVLEHLCRGGLVEEVAGAPASAAAAGGGRAAEPNITFIGHATLLLRAAGLNILTDPWIFPHNKRVNRPPYPITFGDLPELDLLCISHEHGDHLHLPTLMRLDKKTPVVVPLIEEPNKYNRSLTPTLGRLGFRDVTCLRTWESLTLNGLKITRTPCHKAWTVTEQATWLFESPGMTVFCGCDMLEDEQLMRHLGENYRVDVAFLPISGFSQKLGRLPVSELLPAEVHEQTFRDVMGVAEAVQATRWMKPRFAAGYANGGAYWYDHPEGSRSGEPAAEFVELLKKENPAVRGLYMRPGDVWEHGSERVISRAPGV